MKLAWLTDIHLNFLDKEARQQFYQQIVSTHCQAVLISGDIAEAPTVAGVLREMSELIQKPIYFVLGNHDYYRGNVGDVRREITDLIKNCKNLFWLPASKNQCLNDDTIIVGEDGWADGRLGDYQNSRVSLNDSRMIADLFQAKVLGKLPLLEKMQKLADADALHLKESLLQAVNHRPKKIVILTHVPPFKEACMHEGEMSDANWLPFYSSKATGDVLQQLAEKNPSIKFLVLCGHTHSEAYYQPLENLTVQTGKAEYYQPLIEEIAIN